MRTKPRKPTKLRLIEGNRGHRPIPQTPQPAPAMPDPPPHLHAYALEKCGIQHRIQGKIQGTQYLISVAFT